MYYLKYPETNETVPGTSGFETADEAISFWEDKRPTWEWTPVTFEGDAAAFVNPYTGAVVVVRLSI